MDSFITPSLHWPLIAGLALTYSLTFALMGYAMRRLRSHDALAVIVWRVAGLWLVGAGMWSAQTLGLMSLQLPWAQTFAPWRLGVLAMAGMLTMAALQAVARLRISDLARWAIEAVLCTVGLFLLYEVGLLTLAVPPIDRAPGWPLHFEPDALLLALAGNTLSIWLLFSHRVAKRLTLVRRITASASASGIACAGAMALCLSELRFPLQPPPHPAGPLVSVSALGVAVGSIVVFLVVGLVAAWLDTHAYRRNMALTASLNEANLRLRDQALSDALTRMPNRLLFEERMAEALDQVGTTPCALAVLFIDLDGFKPINDSFGHVAGDAVLREVGQRLLAQSRQQDTVARVGGDEFLLMVLQPGTEQVAATVAQRVLQSLNAPFSLPNGVHVNLSASIGIVMYPEHGPAQKLIANADAAMYAAKRAGGSTYAFFEPRMELDAREQLELQHDLRAALERRELELYYQPKIDGRSGQVTGVESLIRWHHPVKGFISPGLFIPVAERFGMIGAIGNWVIEEACRQLADWLRQGLRMRIAVNLSVHQLRQEDLVPRIRSAVQRHGIDPQLLTFEITESVAMEDTAVTTRAFDQLAAAGVSLSIDDFGTGYSSLAYLRKLPAKQLKIDRSFVQDLGTSPDALAVVDAVIKLAHALGLSVVAEGVETARQRDLLLGLHCDELQGYLFARPMSARLLTHWAMGENDGHEHNQGDFRSSLFMDTLPGEEPESVRGALM